MSLELKFTWVELTANEIDSLQTVFIIVPIAILEVRYEELGHSHLVFELNWSAQGQVS